MNKFLKLVFSASSLLFVTNFAYAICAWCPGENKCTLRDGNGFSNCSRGECSGNCVSSQPGSNGTGGWNPPPPIPGTGSDIPRETCSFCQTNPRNWLTGGKWESLVQTLPDAEPSEKGLYTDASCSNCKPEVKGPALKIGERNAAFRTADKNLLLTLALIRFEQTAELGVSDVGAFWFAMPENEKQKQAVLDGANLAFPHNELKGVAGLVTYRTTVPAEKLLAANTQYIEVEMKVWQVNRQKGAPVQGLTSILRFEKAEKSNVWELTLTRTDDNMPAPDLKFFPNLEKNGKILDQFFQKQ